MSWTRLESATVDPDLVEGLEARIADPLWLLARQWQTGEFKGDDAANPLLLQVEARSTRLDRLVLPNGSAVDLREADAPLEPLVEREAVRQGPSGARVTADLGRLLVRALQRVGAPAEFLRALRSNYPVELPADDGLDPVGRRRLDLLARTAVDGAHLAAALEAYPALVDDLLAALEVPEATRSRVAEVVDQWRQTTAGMFSEPGRFTTWNAERLEYEFALEGTGPDGRAVILPAADGYPGGRLDWYAFDCGKPGEQDGTDPPGGVTVRRIEVLPAPLRFRGMPAPRFWTFEEGEVYLGGIEAAPEDLARVAVARYGVVAGDDWWILPLRVPLGTLTQITAVRVLDDFGATTPVPAAAVVDGGGPTRAFKFFELTGDDRPRAGAAPLLFLPPTVEATDAGRPVEDVRFLRDEAANIAWAVEQRIESPAGRPVDLAARTRAAPAAPTTRGGRWTLQLSTSVPGNWVPLIPVRIADDPDAPAEAIMLQRGRVPAAAGDGAGSRGALGRILQPESRLLISEEEIPRAGIRVVRRFQSARTPTGRLFTWVGRRKGPGRGEGDSGLVFDVLERGPEHLPPAG